jgi:DNA ligase D
MAKRNEFGDPVEFVVEGHPIEITSPEKVLFPKPGLTKLDLAKYYVAVGPALMRWIHDRPVLLERYPNGVDGESFYQKRIPESAPKWLSTTMVQTINGTPSRALVVTDLAHVLWAANMGVLGLHVWQYRADRPQWADELRIDLDPSPGQSFDDIREAAMHVRLYFAELGIKSYVKTTGSKGIHVYVRVVDGYDSFAVRGASVTAARDLARLHPDLITDQWWKELREGKVFVDYNQNAPHKTVFGAWSVRARAGGQVSTPFGWDELATIHPDQFTLSNVPARFSAAGDPWAEMYGDPQPLEPLLELHERDMAAGELDAPWPPVYPKMPNEPSRVAPSRARKEE